jgi:predicted Zn-dependent protease
VLVGRLLGGSELGAAKVRELAMLMLRSGFNRDQECEADILGTGRLIAANINPVALADFFGRLKGKNESGKYHGVLSYIASHPDLAERETYLREAAAKQSSDYTPALSLEAWQTLKEAAGGRRTENSHTFK